MSKLDEIRAQYPGAYDDMSDSQLADALYQKHYSDMPRDEFNASMGTDFQARQQMSQMTQHPGPAIAEQRRQQDVAQYAARPPLQRAVQDVSDIFNVAGRSAAGLVTGAAGLVSKGLAPLTGVSAAPISPEDVIARLRTGKTEGPEFAAEVEKQNRISEAARNRLGWAAPVAETLPMVALPVARIFGAGRPLLNLATTSAGLGAASAAGNKENPLLGAAGGAVGGAAGYGAGKLLGAVAEKGLGLLGRALPVGPLKVPPKVPLMTKEDFKIAASAAFDESERHGVIFNQRALTRLKNRVETFVRDKGYHPGLQPKIAHVLSAIDDYANTGNATQRGMQTLRELASGAFEMGNKKNNMFVVKIINEIEDLGRDLRNMSATSNDPLAAQAAAKLGREMSSKGFKLETVENLLEAGRLQGRRNITQNVPERQQAQLTKILDPFSSRGRGFTKLDKKAVEQAALRSGKQAFAQSISGLMPRGKLSTAIHLTPLLTGAGGGLLAGGPIGAALTIAGIGGRMLIGHAAEKWSERMAQKSIDELIHVISTGQTSKQAAQSILQKLTASKRQAVMQGLGRIGMGLGAVAAQPLNEAYRQNE